MVVSLALNATDFCYDFLVIRNITTLHDEKRSSATTGDFFSYLSVSRKLEAPAITIAILLSDLVEERNNTPGNDVLPKFPEHFIRAALWRISSDQKVWCHSCYWWHRHDVGPR